MKMLTANLEDDAPSSYRDWVTAMYMAWLGVGGTSGPLFGMFFRDLAKAGAAGSGADDESQNSEAAREGEPDGATNSTLIQFTASLAAGQAIVQNYGADVIGDN